MGKLKFYPFGYKLYNKLITNTPRLSKMIFESIVSNSNNSNNLKNNNDINIMQQQYVPQMRNDVNNNMNNSNSNFNNNNNINNNNNNFNNNRDEMNSKEYSLSDFVYGNINH
jgi:hypothetical protein